MKFRILTFLLPLTLTPGCASTDKAKEPELVTRAAPPLTRPSEAAKPQDANAPPRNFRDTRPLHVVSLPDPQSPIVNFRLVFRTGSVDDPQGKEGLTHLTSTLMAEGGTRSLTSAQLISALFPMAAELSASTSKELTVFEGRVHRDHLDRFFAIFTDVLLAPRWDPKEFERLRQDALNTVEKSLRNEDDEVLGKVALDALMYQGHPYGHFTVGTIEGLRSVTLEDVKAHAQAVLTQDRLIVGLAGGVDDALQKRLLERLSQLPPKGRPAVQLPAPPSNAGAVWILPKDSLSTAFSLGFPYSVRRGDPDFYELAFAASYFGEHRQVFGTLFSELRDKRGLNYGDYAYAEHFAQAGGSTLPQTNVARRQQSFTLWLRPIESANGIFGLRGALYFFDQFIKNGVPAKDFERTRGFLTGYTRIWEQTAQRRLGYAIDDLLYGTPGFLEGYREAMKRMTPEGVRAAIQRHLSPERLRFAVVGKDGDQLKRILVEQPPTPHLHTRDGKLVEGYASDKPPALLEDDARIAKQPLPVRPEAVEIRPTETFMQSRP